MTSDVKDTEQRWETGFHGRQFRMLIDGELVAGDQTRPVIDPATGSVFANSPVASESNLDRALDAATRALVNWRAVSFAERKRVVEAIIERVKANAEELAQLLVRETGKRLEEARLEPVGAAAFANYFASLDTTSTELFDDDASTIEMHWQPLGVVAAIVPWNFPLHEALYKVLPAILAGNTVVLKPAPSTPLSAMVLGELIVDAVPAGVINILGDDGTVGPRLTADPRVKGVTFTGSTRAGKSVLENSAQNVTRVLLELGGNDAAIVLEDVDVEEVAHQIFFGSFYYSGQVCACIKRIYAHSSIYDALCDRLAEIAATVKVGPGTDPETVIVPVQNADQFERAKHWLSIAHRDGTVIAGGSTRDEPGYYVEPTIVRDIADDSELVAEETFGPIRSVLSFNDVDDAVTRANNSRYGLGASVWSSDVSRAQEIAQRLESGTVWINHHALFVPMAPFGGHKESGLGAEFGPDALKEYMSGQAIFVPKA